MTRINVLTPEIYNKISAGEVIESPVGAVKELVENSIDAGSTAVNIEIENGGFDSIIVSDNGCGIEEDDIQNAFLKHATSKIGKIDDLYNVETLGFRGEALSSISAVSHVTLTTRTEGSDAAIKATIENGVLTDKKYVSGNVGTRIEVRNLFYNTPARKKFFKSEAREGTEVTKYVLRLILTNPTVKITYTLNGQKIFQSSGHNLEAAVYAVYGGTCLENCIKVDYRFNEIAVTGYIGSPEYAKANRTYQTLSVNGRCVSDIALSSVVAQAYRAYLMSHKFAFFILNIELPADQVDVNVHPKKAEVRFANTSRVNSAVYHAVENALKEYSAQRIDSLFRLEQEYGPINSNEMSKPLPADKEDSAEDMTVFQPNIFAIDNIGQNSAENRQQGYYEENPAVRPQDDFDSLVKQMDDVTVEFDEVKPRKVLTDETLQMLQREISVEKARQAVVKTPVSLMQPTVSIDTQNMSPVNVDKEDIDLINRAKILGVAFKTYLIVEIDDKLVYIDQHAAHERILFDKFMQGRSGDFQPLMFPYVFTVKDDEYNFIADNLENIKQAGVVVEPFGANTFRITSVSTLLADTKMDSFVDFLLAGMEEFQIDNRKLIVEKIAQTACKAAVKAGYTLNEYELKVILKEVLQNNVLQCPHGRPVTVVVSKTQIEKMFKRIV